MIILCFLAVIGALCLLSTAAMIVCVIVSEKSAERKSTRKTAANTCVLTDERCIFTVDKGTCKGCPVTEEAENGTSSFNRP